MMRKKKQQIENLNLFHSRHNKVDEDHISHLQKTAINRENTFTALMETVKVASLGQISHALYVAGGEYRRNM